MRSIQVAATSLFLWCFFNPAAVAQEDSTDEIDSILIDTLPMPPIDTLTFLPSEENYPAARVTSTVDLEDHLYQNPTLALFKSMVIPGWGQLGNRSYIKAGVVVGLQTWLISSAVKRGRETNDAKRIFDQVPNPASFAVWDEKRKSRNQYIWLAGIVTFLSMFDAYVDAHLSGSPTDRKNDKFGFEITPMDQCGVSAAVSYSF